MHGGAPTRPSKPPQPPLLIPPGHVAFRLLCHASRIGGLIGKSGHIIKHLQHLTSSRIRVEDPPPSSDNRVISVVASPAVVKRIKLCAEESNGGAGIEEGGGEEEGEVWFDVSAGQEGVVRVFERVVQVAAEGDAAAGIGGVVSCRLLVSKFHGGAVIGKGGKVVEKIRKDTGCKIKVLAVEKNYSNLPAMDEIVEIEGLGLAVKKALVAVTSRIQEFPPSEETRSYPTRPLESEPLPIQAVDLPQQRSPILQPTPSNYINHSWGGGTSSVPEKVSYMSPTIPQLEVVFKILCPNEQVGSIIGKGGCIVKAIQHETGASISIGSPVDDCDERLITITAMESVESKYSPAQKATIVVFTRSTETGLLKGFRSDPKESPVSARVLLASNQVGCLLGKGGVIISEMRKMTGTSLRIIGGDQVPKCASENEEVLQITGEFANVQDALYKVSGRLRDNMFSNRMLNGNRNRNYSRTENDAYVIVRNRPAYGSHQSLADSDKTNEHKSLTQSLDHLAISSNNDRLLTPSSFTSVTLSGANQRNIMATGRSLATVKSGEEIGSGTRPTIAANTMTVEIVVPEAAVVSISGENNIDFARLRQISRATVILQEARPGTTERTVVISGTPDETQAAQSLLQAFILSAS
ncbi:KH domain-containing protein HEN4-like [Salvia divinorum]|uniref:KH domain-containing protein HEN4-like n=1 Tax=Salvia divinorum TaxID=28513 RepID=A0ABD1FU70_SALDI